MLQKVSLYITLLISFSRYFMKDQVNFSNLLLSVVRPSYSTFLLFDLFLTRTTGSTITKLGIGIFMGRGFKKKGKPFLKDLDTI